MQIEIQARGFSLTPGLHAYIQQHLVNALAHIREDVRKVAVRLSDDNGPRHGNDKRCLIRVALRGQNDVVVKDIRGDMYTAISHATNRAAHSVKKLLQHRHNWRSSAGNETALQVVSLSEKII